MAAPERLQELLRRHKCAGDAFGHLLADIAGMGLRTPAELDGFLRRRCPAAALSSLVPHSSGEAILLGAQLPAPALATLAGAWQTQLRLAVQHVAEDGLWDDAPAAPM
eukprot:3138374-Alexandrium_andersonii.AAC.1